MRPFIQYLLANEYAIVVMFLFTVIGIINTVEFLIKILSRYILHRDVEFKYTWR